MTTKYMVQFVHHQHGARSKPVFATESELKELLSEADMRCEDDEVADSYVLLVGQHSEEKGFEITTHPLMKVSTLLAFFNGELAHA